MRTKELLVFFAVGAALIVYGFVIEGGLKKVPPTPHVLGSSSDSVRKTVLVSSVVDGDTVVTSGGEVIRYIGINAPEKGQPFYEEAKELNARQVSAKTVEVEYDVQTRDRYGRTLAYVFSNDVFVNEEMVKNGLAVSETIAPNSTYQDKILQAQETARKNCLGIWSGLCLQANTQAESISQCVKIIEIEANAHASDLQNRNNEWITIGNSCSKNVSLYGWLIKDNSSSNAYAFKNYTALPNSQLRIHSGCGDDSVSDLYWKCPQTQYPIWNNDHDHAFLYSANGNLISDYSY